MWCSRARIHLLNSGGGSRSDFRTMHSSTVRVWIGPEYRVSLQKPEGSPTHVPAHNSHTGWSRDQVLSGFARGAIDRGVSMAAQKRKARRGLDQWLDAVILRAFFPVDECIGDDALVDHNRGVGFLPRARFPGADPGNCARVFTPI